MNNQPEQPEDAAVVPKHSIFWPATVLAVVALLSTSVVVLTNTFTQQRIEEMRQQTIREQLQQVLPVGLYNNDILTDTIELMHPLLGSNTPQTVWRARLDGKATAAVLSATAPDGYGGPITLLIGIGHSGHILGVRVINHRETPGLGDAIEATKSDWIRAFNSYSLVSLPSEAWGVKKDGGHFDHFTGATITPRAITSAVYSALNYFRENQESIFAPAS